MKENFSSFILALGLAFVFGLAGAVSKLGSWEMFFWFVSSLIFIAIFGINFWIYEEEKQEIKNEP